MQGMVVWQQWCCTVDRLRRELLCAKTTKNLVWSASSFNWGGHGGSIHNYPWYPRRRWDQSRCSSYAPHQHLTTKKMLMFDNDSWAPKSHRSWWKHVKANTLALWHEANEAPKTAFLHMSQFNQLVWCRDGSSLRLHVSIGINPLPWVVSTWQLFHPPRAVNGRLRVPSCAKAKSLTA